jgi:hypothetical protein
VIADLAAARDSAGRYNRHTLADWLRNLSLGLSRLPDGLTGDVMRHLLGVYLDGGKDVGQSSMTCDGCGLERPMAKGPATYEEFCRLGPPPEFYDRCPHCGGTQWGWTHLRDESRDIGPEAGIA